MAFFAKFGKALVKLWLSNQPSKKQLARFKEAQSIIVGKK
jgi:hypothetical protein